MTVPIDKTHGPRYVAEWLNAGARRNDQASVGVEWLHDLDVLTAIGIDHDEEFQEMLGDVISPEGATTEEITAMMVDVEAGRHLAISDRVRYSTHALGENVHPGDVLTAIKVPMLRGIAPATWTGRGCRPYQQGDKWVTEEFRRFLRARGVDGAIKASPGVKARKAKGPSIDVVNKVVRQSPGWFMPRHPIPGKSEIPPQLRPDGDVFLDLWPTWPKGKPWPTWHHHGPIDVPWPKGKPWPTFPDAAGVKLAGRNLHLDRVMYQVAADRHVNKTSDHAYDPATGEGTHNGRPVDGVHKHAAKARKYLSLARPGAGSRIDLHPLALAALPAAETVFFVLEGIPKTDAVISNGGVAFGVPSVTAWDRDELEGFAEDYLQGKRVVIVPDSDWSTNWQVERQALKVRTLLRRYGIVAEVAAPPQPADPSVKVGVDDFLDAGHELGELVFLGREAPMGRIERAVWLNCTYQRRPSALDALERLSLYTTGVVEGRTFSYVKALLGCDKNADRVVPLLKSIAFAFEITHGSLDVEKYSIPYTKRVWTGWRDQPTILLREEFRSR